MMSFKKEFRELKLSRLEKEDSGIIIKNNLFGFFSNFSKVKRTVKNILKEDGVVLTGSHALNCYYLSNDTKVSDRSQFNDWDILIHKDRFIEISKKFGFYDLNNIKNNIYTIKTPSDPYGRSGTAVHLIIVNDLPKYNEVGDYKISILEDIIKFKMDLLEGVHKFDLQKHYNDLTNIFMNLNH